MILLAILRSGDVADLRASTVYSANVPTIPRLRSTQVTRRLDDPRKLCETTMTIKWKVESSSERTDGQIKTLGIGKFTIGFNMQCPLSLS